MARDGDVAGHTSAKVSTMEPDSKGPKSAAEDRRQTPLVSSDTRSVDALQVKLFAKALADLGLAKYSALVIRPEAPSLR